MSVGKYIMNILIGIDQLGNSILAGNPDETISSRIGKIKRDQGGTIPWRSPVTKLTDIFLDTIDLDHSIDAIEYDEGTGPVILVSTGWAHSDARLGIDIEVRKTPKVNIITIENKKEKRAYCFQKNGEFIRAFPVQSDKGAGRS